MSTTGRSQPHLTVSGFGRPPFHVSCPKRYARYHPATEILTVHSGHVTDTLTLLSKHGTHFIAANDGHGGTKVTLEPPPVTATPASLSTHDIIGHDWATQIDGGNHTGDFLITA